MRRATAALFQRLPHPASAEAAETDSRRRPRWHARRRGARARAGTGARAFSGPRAPVWRTAGPATEPATETAVVGGVVAAHPDGVPEPVPAALDPRVREAGGPMDNASYSCACGLVFAAAVSTTVSCPHCGANQAW